MNKRFQKKIYTVILIIIGINLSFYISNVIKLPTKLSKEELFPCLNLGVAHLITRQYLEPILFWSNEKFISTRLIVLKDKIYISNIKHIKNNELKFFWWYVIQFKPNTSTTNDLKIFSDINVRQELTKIVNDVEFNLGLLKQSKNIKLLGPIREVLAFYANVKPNVYCYQEYKFLDCRKIFYQIDYPYRKDKQEIIKLEEFYHTYSTIFIASQHLSADHFLDLMTIRSVLANLISYKINNKSFNCHDQYVSEFVNVEGHILGTRNKFMASMGYPVKVNNYIEDQCLSK